MHVVCTFMSMPKLLVRPHLFDLSTTENSNCPVFEAKKTRRIIRTTRVMTGEDMMLALKDKEEAIEKEQEAKEERKRIRERKKEEKEVKMQAKKESTEVRRSTRKKKKSVESVMDVTHGRLLEQLYMHVPDALVIYTTFCFHCNQTAMT